MIGFEQTVYTATEGVGPAVELCAIVIGSTILERTARVSFATRDGSATSIGGYGERIKQSSVITVFVYEFFINIYFGNLETINLLLRYCFCMFSLLSYVGNLYVSTLIIEPKRYTPS